MMGIHHQHISITISNHNLGHIFFKNLLRPFLREQTANGLMESFVIYRGESDSNDILFSIYISGKDSKQSVFKAWKSQFDHFIEYNLVSKENLKYAIVDNFDSQFFAVKSLYESQVLPAATQGLLFRLRYQISKSLVKIFSEEDVEQESFTTFYFYMQIAILRSCIQDMALAGNFLKDILSLLRGGSICNNVPYEIALSEYVFNRNQETLVEIIGDIYSVENNIEDLEWISDWIEICQLSASHDESVYQVFIYLSQILQEQLGFAGINILVQNIRWIQSAIDNITGCNADSANIHKCTTGSLSPAPIYDCVEAIINVDGHLSFIDHGGYESRNESTINLFRQAFALITDKSLVGPKRFFINTSDESFVLRNSLTFGYTCSEQVESCPDFSFDKWIECGIVDYEETINEILLMGTHSYSIEKLFWCGNLGTQSLRNKLFKLGQEHSARMEILSMDWERHELKGFMHGYTKYVSLCEHTKYKYLIDCGASGFSARLTFLLHSNRPLFLVDRPVCKQQFYYEKLRPYYHYIPVKSDLSDLVCQLEWAECNREKVQEIAGNARMFALNHLSKTSVIQYLSQKILSHATPKLKLFSICTPDQAKLRTQFEASVQDNWEIHIEYLERQKDADSNFGSEDWHQVIRRKIELLIEKVMENWDSIIIWSDLDIQFFSRASEVVMADMVGKDILFQSDCWPSRQINTGFCVIRCNIKTLLLFKAVLQYDLCKLPHADQTAVNDILRLQLIDLVWDILPSQFWAMSHLNRPPSDIILHHANCTASLTREGKVIGSLELKLEQLQIIKNHVIHNHQRPFEKLLSYHKRKAMEYGVMA